MAWVTSAAGTLIVVVALLDIFHTLWHPGGFGGIARGVFRSVWWATKRTLPRHGRTLAGPIGLLAAVVTWSGLMIVGWMLVYLPRMPDGFYFGSSLRPEQSSDVLAALYLSMVTVATLGFGDIIPRDPALRLLTPLEALLGFVLLTAAISWVLQIYPALGRRRAAAKRLSVLRSSHSTDLLVGGDPSVATQWLDSVTDGVIQAEVDYMQYAESYYFLEKEEEMSLPAMLPYAREMVRAGSRSPAAEVRVAADMLDASVEGLALRLDGSFLRTGGSTEQVLAAYAADHGIDSGE